MAIDSKYGRVTMEHGTIGDDEPVVVFRAQDRLLPAVLDFYLAVCAKEGSPQQHLDAILDAKAPVVEWQNSNHTQTPQSATYQKQQ